MKRTLIISGHYPLPEHFGQNMRAMNLVRFFLKFGPVDIAYSSMFPGAPTGNPMFAHEYFLPKEDYAKSRKKRVMRYLGIPKAPLEVIAYPDFTENKLMSLLEAHDYDYILVRYIMNTGCLFKTKKYKHRIIVDFDDIQSGSLYDAKFEANNGMARKLLLGFNKRFLIRYEKKCLNFGAALFCSEKDKAQMTAERNHVDAFVVPNIYYQKPFFEAYHFGDGFANNDVLLFLGLLSYQPNIDGLKWFLDTIFADFKKAIPAAKLLVVGRSPAPEVINFCRGRDGVELFADVPEVACYYKQSRAVVVPLLSGGGTRIKILEAALANRPVLSTAIGAEGLDLAAGKDFLLFEDKNDFIRDYRQLANVSKYHCLVHNARKAVLSKYSRQNFEQAMQQVLSCIDHKNAAAAKAKEV